MKETHNIINLSVLIIGETKFLNKMPKKSGIANTYHIITKDIQNINNLQDIALEITTHKYNIIMCNMTIDNLFRDDLLLDEFINLVHTQLLDHGLFCGVAIDGDKIIELFVNHDTVNRDLFRMEVNNITNSLTPYGNTYELEVDGILRDHYIITKEELQRIAYKHDLIFIGNMNFETWLNNYLESEYNNLNKDQKAFSSLHFSYFFKKLHKE